MANTRSLQDVNALTLGASVAILVAVIAAGIHLDQNDTNT